MARTARSTRTSTRKSRQDATSTSRRPRDSGDSGATPPPPAPRTSPVNEISGATAAGNGMVTSDPTAVDETSIPLTTTLEESIFEELSNGFSDFLAEHKNGESPAQPPGVEKRHLRTVQLGSRGRDAG